jgi:hypothetical protein
MSRLYHSITLLIAHIDMCLDHVNYSIIVDDCLYELVDCDTICSHLTLYVIILHDLI